MFKDVPPFDKVAQSIAEEIKYAKSLADIEALLSRELEEMYAHGVAQTKENVANIIQNYFTRKSSL